MRLAGAAGRLNAIDTHFDWNNRYNLWSGLIGSTFLMLAYFGTDQSQVQRYLTGRSIAQSRLGLLLNAMAKVPVQFLILFIGTMVFVFFLFVRPPLLFHPVQMTKLEQSAAYPALQARYEQAWTERADAARASEGRHADRRLFARAEEKLEAVRAEAQQQSEGERHELHFPHLRAHYLPRGLGGTDSRRDLHRGHVVELGRNQLARHRLDDRYLPAPRHRRIASTPLSARLARRDDFLGRVRRHVREFRAGFRSIDRSRESGGLAVLWQHAGRVRRGVFHESAEAPPRSGAWWRVS